jgi:ABC-2 type transport system ATP-binding protein
VTDARADRPDEARRACCNARFVALSDIVPPAPHAHRPAPIVALESVTKIYGDVIALSGLDLSVAPGQVYGFLGRNGAGKSTTLRIIMGITRATAGHVRLFDEATAADRPALRRRIGYVAQEQNFYGWMTPQYLGRFLAGFFPTWDSGEYQRLLHLLDVPPDRAIQTFSGGMQAKLALAAALAHRPELLVLDEPTAGMDAVTRREFLALVREQARRSGRATLFSSHLIDEVELAADTIGIVDGGRMAWQGPIDSLRAQTRSLVGVGSDVALWPLPPLGHAIKILEDRTEADRRTVILAAADPSAFTDLVALDAPWQIVHPPLEDVFVAMVGKRLAY